MHDETDSIKIRDLRNGDWYWVPKVIYDKYINKIGSTGLSIYNALCFYSNQNNSCFPSVKLISIKLNISEPTIYKYLKLLEESKLIKRVNRKHKGKSNIYYLLKPFNTPPKTILYPPLKPFNTNKNKYNKNNTILGSKEPSKRKISVFPKDDYTLVLKKYQELKGITLQGEEFKPIQQSIKTMFLSKRTPQQIIDCMEFISEDNFLKDVWTIKTVQTKLPEFIAGNFEPREEIISEDEVY